MTHSNLWREQQKTSGRCFILHTVQGRLLCYANDTVSKEMAVALFDTGSPYLYIHAHTHTHTQTRTHTHTHTHIRTHFQSLLCYANVAVFFYVSCCSPWYRPSIYIYIWIYIYTHIHTQIRTHCVSLWFSVNVTVSFEMWAAALLDIGHPYIFI